MPDKLYSFKALTADGRLMSGIAKAANDALILEELQRCGLHPLTVQRSGQRKGFFSRVFGKMFKRPASPAYEPSAEIRPTMRKLILKYIDVLLEQMRDEGGESVRIVCSERPRVESQWKISGLVSCEVEEAPSGEVRVFIRKNGIEEVIPHPPDEAARDLITILKGRSIWNFRDELENNMRGTLSDANGITHKLDYKKSEMTEEILIHCAEA